MLKFTVAAIALLSLSGAADAACFGSANFQTCTDSSGNSYSTNRFGNTSTTTGRSRTGSTWSQTTTDYGNTSSTTGRAANGNSWNSNRYDLGNGNSIYSGRDSDGDAFSGSCIGGFCN